MNEDALRSGSITTDDGESIASGSASEGEGHGDQGTRGVAIGQGARRGGGGAPNGGVGGRQQSLVAAARDEMGGSQAARAVGLIPPRSSHQGVSGGAQQRAGAQGASAMVMPAAPRGGSMSSGTGTDGEFEAGRVAGGSMDSGTESGRDAAASFVDQGNWWEQGR